MFVIASTTFDCKLIWYCDAQNKGLTQLSLRNNNVHNYGATRLAIAMKRNRTLLHLDLGDNPLLREWLVSIELSSNTIMHVLRRDQRFFWPMGSDSKASQVPD